VLFALPTPDEPELRVIARIDELRRGLHYGVTQKLRWSGLLRRSTLARAIQGSNSIEGIDVSVEDAIAVAEGEEPLDADAETRAAIAGYQKAMTYALQLSDDPHFAWSAEGIRSLHFMILNYDLAKHPGRWRPGPIFVRDDARGETVYEGPDAERVPALMDELVAWLREGDARAPAMVRAALGHLNLVMVHPFADGNGRMARCLQTLMLARERILDPHFCSIEEYLGRNTRAYYAVLAEVGGGSWQPSRDARPWIRFNLTAHYRQAMTLQRRQREMQRVWEGLEQEVRARSLPERTLLALADAAFGWKVRNATYRSAAEISDQVASRDLKALADAGLLVAHGERRGRWYAASDLVRTVRERFREAKPIADPFELEAQGTLF
jgi:Fic family protein